MATIKITPILGEVGYGSDWYSEEQWEKQNAYIEQLKKEGKYLTNGEPVTIHFQEKDIFDSPTPTFNFKNFGIFVPINNIKTHGKINKQPKNFR